VSAFSFPVFFKDGRRGETRTISKYLCKGSELERRLRSCGLAKTRTFICFLQTESLSSPCSISRHILLLYSPFYDNPLTWFALSFIQFTCLSGFHHLTDELDALDPLTSSSLATLKSSSRWDSLFDPSSPYTPESPVIVEDAAYGIPSSLLPPNVRDEINALLGVENGNSVEDKVAPDVEEKKKGLSREAREALEECAKRGAVGFGIRWSNPGKVGEGESLWGWIWGEEASQSNEDYDDEEDDEGEDGGEDETRYKAVHFVKAEEEEGDEDAAGGRRGGDNGQDEELVNDGGDLGDL
jgi:hypothetical protein